MVISNFSIKYLLIKKAAPRGCPYLLASFTTQQYCWNHQIGKSSNYQIKEVHKLLQYLVHHPHKQSPYHISGHDDASH